MTTKREALDTLLRMSQEHLSEFQALGSTYNEKNLHQALVFLHDAVRTLVEDE